MFVCSVFVLLAVLTVTICALPVAENQPDVQQQQQPQQQQQQLTSFNNGRYVLLTPVSQLNQPLFRAYPQFLQPTTLARIDGFRQDEGGDNNWWGQIQNWWQGQTGGGSSEGGDSSGSDNKEKDKDEKLNPEKYDDKFKGPKEQKLYFYVTPASTVALDPLKRYYYFPEQPTQYFTAFDSFPTAPLNPAFGFQSAFLARSNAAKTEIQSAASNVVGNAATASDVQPNFVNLVPYGNPKTDAIAAVLNNRNDPLQTMAIASAPLQPNLGSPELQSRLSTVELSSVVSSQVQNNIPLVLSEARSQVSVPAEAVARDASSSKSNSDENNYDNEGNEQKRKGDPSIAQAKPTAIAVAGAGGVASSSPRATAVAAGNGGLAVASPTATAVSGDLFGSGSDTLDVTDNVDDDKKQRKN